jgi:hypothetical protein
MASSRCSALVFLALFAAADAQEVRRNAVTAWDARASSPEPYRGDFLDASWKAVEVGAALEGDLVVSNGRLVAVARKRGTGLELYSYNGGHPVLRSTLQVGAGPLERIDLSEFGRTLGVVTLAWKGSSAKFHLAARSQFVETQALSGDAPLRLETPGRFVVLPDFFADDILVDARRLPLDRVELPSENFVLHFNGNHDAIVMGVFENRDQDVRVTLAGKDQDRHITGSEIAYGQKGRKIWVSVLEGPGLWYSVDIGPEDKKKILPLDWKMPFVAQWRCDYTRKDDLTDSWDLLLPAPDGAGFIKPSWITQDGKISDPSKTATGEVDPDAYKPGGPASDRLGPDRNRWTTVLGRVQYPCWTDAERKGFLQPLDHKKVLFSGPVLLYPMNRLAETPVEWYTPVDVVRNTLGVGPCQYLLDVEGQKQEHVGRATCHVRTLLNDTYGAGQQKAKRKEIENYLNDGHDFVTHIRNRVLAYVAFGHDLGKFLASEREAHPELKEAIESLETITKEIDTRVGAHMDAMKKNPRLAPFAAEVAARNEETTPPALAAALNRTFQRTLLDYDGADWKERLKKEYTDPLTAIGGAQDEMVGECRWVVKALRQKAGILMATDPKLAPLAAEVRARTQKILRGGAAYEGARH